MAERKATIGIEVKGADTAKLDFKAIGDAAKDMGTGGAVGVTELLNAFEEVVNDLAKIETKLQSGAKVTQRETDAMGADFEILGARISKSFGSLDKAPAEIQEAFAKVEASARRTTPAVAAMNDAAADSRIKFQTGAQQVQSMGSAVSDLSSLLPGAAGEIGQTSGQLANMVTRLDAAKDALSAMKVNALDGKQSLSVLAIQVAAVAGVWNAATDVGVELAKAMGANSKTADEYAKSVSFMNIATMGMTKHWENAKAGLVGWNAAAEAGIPIMERMKATAEEQIRVGALYNESMKLGAEGQKFYAEALKESGGDVDKLTKILDAGLPAIREHAKAIEDTATAHKEASKDADAHVKAYLAFQEALKAGAPQLDAQVKAWEKHRGEIEKATESLKRNTEELGKQQAELSKQQGLFDAAATSVAGMSSQLGYYERSLSSATSELDAQRTKVADLSAQYGASSPMTQQAIEAQRQMEQAVASAKQRVDDQAESVKKNEAAMEAAKSKVDDLKTKNTELEAAIAKNKTTTDSATTSTTAQESVQVSLTRVMKDGKETWTLAAAEAEKLGKGIVSIKDAAGEVPSHLGRVSDELAKANPQFSGASKSLGEFAQALKDSNTAADTLINKMPTLVEAMNRLNEATKAASGGSARGSAPSPGDSDFVGPIAPGS